MSDVWQGPGYWLASDGKWYSPQVRSSQWEGYGTTALREPAERRALDTYEFAVGPSTSGQSRRANRRNLRWASAGLGALIVATATLVAVSGKPTTWDPRVLGIVRFDEQHRGLMFKQPVKVEFLDTAQFNKEVSTPQPTTTAARATEKAALEEFRALGLVHGNVDLVASENRLNQSDVVGLYVDNKKTVFVRGTALTPYVKVTLAHELTHALQDQYFNLEQLRQGVKGGDDTAVTALIEGDAVRDETLYEQSLSPADQQRYQTEQNQLDKGSGQAADVPQILSDILAFPYAFGPTFVDSLDAKGGTPAIDGAFRDPPVAEAQIVDPVEYPIGWKPTPVAIPALAAGERRVDTPSPFGQVSLFEVLGSRLGYDQAWSAVQGWQGDNSLPYKDGGRTCMAIDVDMASTASAAHLSDAAHAWAHTMPGATVTLRGNMVDLRSCDPGPKAPGPPTITPSAFDELSTRAGTIDAVMTGAQVDFAMGKCIVDKVLVEAGPSGYGELTANNLSASQQAQLQQQAASAGVSCKAAGVR